MIVTKNDLQFLNLYALCMDQKSKIGKNFQIKNIDKSTIRFSQITDDSVLFTDIKSNVSEDFSFNYPTDKIVQLLNTCLDDEHIEFTENSVKICSNGALYQFEKIDYDITDNTIFEYDKSSKIEIKDLDKMNTLKFYLSNEKGLDCIALFNNYMVASNKYDATACIKTENKYRKNFFISNLFVNIIKTLKLNEITIFDEEKKYSIHIDNTIIIVPKREYIIPNIFDEKFKKFYRFETHVIVNRESLLMALSRINIFARENVNNRVFISFKENEIVIESKDKGYAVEKVKANVDKSLIDHFVILSSNYIYNSLNILDTENVILKIFPNRQIEIDKKIVNTPTISIWQQGKEDLFIIHNLLKYTE